MRHWGVLILSFLLIGAAQAQSYDGYDPQCVDAAIAALQRDLLAPGGVDTVVSVSAKAAEAMSDCAILIREMYSVRPENLFYVLVAAEGVDIRVCADTTCTLMRTTELREVFTAYKSRTDFEGRGWYGIALEGFNPPLGYISESAVYRRHDITVQPDNSYIELGCEISLSPIEYASVTPVTIVLHGNPTNGVKFYRHDGGAPIDPSPIPAPFTTRAGTTTTYFYYEPISTGTYQVELTNAAGEARRIGVDGALWGNYTLDVICPEA